MSSTMTIAKVKPVEVIFVEKPNVREEIKIRGPKGKEDTVVVDEQPSKEQIVEAEDIAGLNLGKLRQVQSDLYSSHCGHIILILT